MQQRPNKRFPIPTCQSPRFMLLDSPYSSSISAADHEVRDRSAFETGCIFDATFLVWVEAGFYSLDFLELSLLRLSHECHRVLTALVYGSLPYISMGAIPLRLNVL
jgi:hypothetical protein